MFKGRRSFLANTCHSHRSPFLFSSFFSLLYTDFPSRNIPLSLSRILFFSPKPISNPLVFHLILPIFFATGHFFWPPMRRGMWSIPLFVLFMHTFSFFPFFYNFFPFPYPLRTLFLSFPSPPPPAPHRLPLPLPPWMAFPSPPMAGLPLPPLPPSSLPTPFPCPLWPGFLLHPMAGFPLPPSCLPPPTPRPRSPSCLPPTPSSSFDIYTQISVVSGNEYVCSDLCSSSSMVTAVVAKGLYWLLLATTAAGVVGINDEVTRSSVLGDWMKMSSVEVDQVEEGGREK